MLDTEGLSRCTACDEHCRSGLWSCQYRRVEQRLGRPVDHRHPDDVAIGVALQIEAEDRAYEGRNHQALIVQAANEGTITPQRRNLLLRLDRAFLTDEVAAAAVEIVYGTDEWASLRYEPGFRPLRDRVWRDDLNEAEQTERHRLEETRFNAGLSPNDVTSYEVLTTFQPAERPSLSQLPDDLLRAAHDRVRIRKQRVRGELLRTRRVSAIDRHRVRTFETPSFNEQLGRRLASEHREREIAKLVRELRRQAKDLGFLPRDHDRRKKPATRVE